MRVWVLLLMVSTHSRPKAAGPLACLAAASYQFQHTAARRRLGFRKTASLDNGWFQHTAARRRLEHKQDSRLCGVPCFNTQPPEGGWKLLTAVLTTVAGFQHTAARRRLGGLDLSGKWLHKVSTHSRPKAAGI